MREAYKPCLSAGDLRRRSGPIACGWQDDGCPSRKHSRCLANAWNRSLSRMDVLKSGHPCPDIICTIKGKDTIRQWYDSSHTGCSNAATMTA
ncbi:uncharacterized protein LOC142586868 isoform X3 [Dermacentor variabilis]|uniref:uncharacterized protein LOC142586868 isoform X3 n=1 Tax=Dermacentor variabilis TaxID=34621 RepID=UPI003F5B6A6F